MTGALFLGAVTAWVTSHPEGRHVLTNVPCRRSPGRRRYSGTIHAALAPDGAMGPAVPGGQPKEVTA